MYFVVSVAALGIFLHQQWVHSIWPEIRVPKPEPDDAEDWTPVHPRCVYVCVCDVHLCLFTCGAAWHVLSPVLLRSRLPEWPVAEVM